MSELKDDLEPEDDGWIVGQSSTPCLRPQVFYHPLDPRIILTLLGSDWMTVDDKSGKVISTWSDKVNANEIVATTPFSQSLHVVSASSETVRVVDVRTGREISVVKLSSFNYGRIFPLEISLSRDDRILAVVASLNAIESFPDPKALAKNNDIKENQDADKVHKLRLFLIDIERGNLLGSFDFEDHYPRRISFSRDGKSVSVVSYSGLRFFSVSHPDKIDLISHIEISEFSGFYEDRFPFVFGADVSHDNRLAVISFGSSLLLVDMESRKVIPSFKWSLDPANFMFAIRWLSWSSDDRHIYASDLSSSVYKLSGMDGDVEAKGRIDYVSQDWVRGPYFEYLSNRPQAVFAMSPLGQSFVAFAPQDFGRPMDCPGLRIQRIKSH